MLYILSFNQRINSYESLYIRPHAQITIRHVFSCLEIISRKSDAIDTEFAPTSVCAATNLWVLMLDLNWLGWLWISQLDGLCVMSPCVIFTIDGANYGQCWLR